MTYVHESWTVENVVDNSHMILLSGKECHSLTGSAVTVRHNSQAVAAGWSSMSRKLTYDVFPRSLSLYPDRCVVQVSQAIVATIAH